MAIFILLLQTLKENKKISDRGDRRRAGCKSERGEWAPRRQGETPPAARRQRAGTAVAGPATGKETRSGSAASEGRPTRSRSRSVPAPEATKRDRQGSRSAEGNKARPVAQAFGSRRFPKPRSKTKAGAQRRPAGLRNFSRTLRSNVGSRGTRQGVAFGTGPGKPPACGAGGETSRGVSYKF